MTHELFLFTKFMFKILKRFNSSVSTTLKPPRELNAAEVSDFALNLNSALQGDASSMLLTGNSYLSGKGTEKSTEEASNWFEKAAQLGNTTALIQFGKSLSKGPDKDLKNSFQWILKAAQHNNLAAAHIVSNAYTRAGPDQDFKMALF